ncbi:MAG: DUF2029 domain-containing protein, partial [Solobacterium sp.]|nr:DUF2029 domain-containing protein [Solobacterium sp.]
AYVLYHFLYRISSPDGSGPHDWMVWGTPHRYQLVYFGYLLFTAGLIFLGIHLHLRRRRKVFFQTCLLTFSILFSAAFLGSGFLVGNSTMTVVGVLLIALYLRDSESRLAKEVALILIAACAGLKLYPAVFGFLYLKEKSWAETVRLALYGIAFFTVPFYWFGGIGGAKMWVGHILGTMGGTEYGRIQFIKGLSYMILAKLSGSETSAIVQTGSSIMPLVFLVLMITLSSLSRSRFRTILFYTCAMVFFPSNAFRYTLGYMAIPLVYWFVSAEQQGTFLTGITDVLFGNIFTIPLWFGVLTGFASNFGYYTLTYVEVWIYTAAYLLLLMEIIIECRSLASGK